MNLSIWIAILLGGYMVGSISPSYILGRVLRKIDIRAHGTQNAGTMNTFHVLGLGPAVITAFFDTTKGLLVMYAAHLLGASPLLIHLAGCAAIAGHVFPFYLKFKGGQGVAIATSMLIYYLVLFYIREWLPLETLLVLAFWVLSFVYIAKKGEIVSTVVLPVVGVFVAVFSAFSQYTLFILTVMAYILLIDILNIRERRLLKPPPSKGKADLNWRLYLRPLAILLAVYYMHTDKKQALTLIGSIALFFLLLDLIRLVSRKINLFFFNTVKKIYKLKELKTFSSITIFLFAFFLTVLLFPKDIAILAAGFLTFGDFFSKFFGIHFGRVKIFEKSFEGSLAHFNACLLSGYVFLHFFSFPFLPFLLGALIASVSEVLPIGINDNFSVAILSASSMYVVRLF
ncbi:MAG: glycerol-3-phosphate acyltransferase [Candidatus Aminicenantales bacterium]